MPNVTIIISTPTLVGSDYFKVRQRLIGGSYSAYHNETNAPFMLSLAVGNWEFEVIYVKVDASVSPAIATECDPTYFTRVVTEEFTCIPFAAEIIQIGAQYVLHITYTQTSPPTNPPCGWDVIFSQSGTAATTVPYATLPNSGVIDITLPQNGDVALIIRANLCNGNYQNCFDDDVIAPVASCIPFTNVMASLRFTNGGYYLDIVYVGSNPATTFINAHYAQTYPVVAGADFGGSITPPGTHTQTVPPNTTVITFKVNPTPHPITVLECIQYKGNIVDVCEQVHEFCCCYPVGCVSCG